MGSYALGEGPPAGGHEQPRGLLREPVRLAALRALLPPLQREGLGRPHQGDVGRLRRPAVEGHVAHDRDRRVAHAEGDQGAAGQGRAGHVAHRVVQLPEVRPRPDVGEGAPRSSPTPGARSSSTRRSCASATATARPTRSTPMVDGQERTFPCTNVISSMPFRSLIRAIDPPVPDEVRAAAEGLTYRDFMTVALVVPVEYSFPDNWIYIHDPGVKVGRIQNFGSWSPYLVKEGRTCLGLEFFVNEGDDMWTKSDEDLVEQGKRELQQLGLGRREQGRGRLRGADAEGVSRSTTSTTRTTSPILREWIAANAPERDADGPQRHAQVQQPGPLDDDGDPLGRQHLRCPQRRVVGERRGPVPRGPRRRRGRRQHRRRAGDRSRRAGAAAFGDRRGRRACDGAKAPDAHPGVHAHLHRGGEHRGVPPAGPGRAARGRHPRPRRQQSRRHRRHRRAGGRGARPDRGAAPPREAGARQRLPRRVRDRDRPRVRGHLPDRRRPLARPRGAAGAHRGAWRRAPTSPSARGTCPAVRSRTGRGDGGRCRSTATSTPASCCAAA